MFCANCGNQIVAGAMFCGKCGTPAPANASGPAQSAAAQAAAPAYTAPQPGAYAQPAYGVATPPKTFVATWLFSLFLGQLGIDRFYTGHAGLGVGKLLVTLFTFGFGGWVWQLVDLILLLNGSFKDSYGRALEGYEQNKKMAIWVTIGVWVVLPVLLVIFFALIAAAAASSSYYY